MNNLLNIKTPAHGIATALQSDYDLKLAGLYNPRGATPFTVLIDAEGRRVWAHEGFVAGDAEDIEARIRALLAEASGSGDGAGGGGGAQ